MNSSLDTSAIDNGSLESMPTEPRVGVLTNLTMSPVQKRGAMKNQDARLFFSLTVTDLRLDINGDFHPSKLILIIKRNRDKYVSRDVEWEPSLKCPRSGFSFFDPPLTAKLSTSLKDTDNSRKRVRLKECSVSVYNLESKIPKRRRLLAKVKFDLWSNLPSVIEPKRLRLLPESKKVSKCFVTMAIKYIECDSGRCLNQDQSSFADGKPDQKNLKDIPRQSDLSFSYVQKSGPSDQTSSTSSLQDQKVFDSDSCSSDSNFESNSKVVQNQLPTKNYETEFESAYQENLQNSSFRVSQENTIQISQHSLAKSIHKDLLHWAQERLESTRVKATNLSTSWRNGIAFCHLLHHMYPDLIPLNEISSNTVDNNFGVLFDALTIVKVPVPEYSDNDTSSPSFVIWVLRTLKEISESELLIIPKDTISLHQIKWNNVAGFFQNSEVTSDESPSEGTSQNLTQNGGSLSEGKNRLKVKSLINAAHSLNENEDEKMDANSFDLNAKEASLSVEMKALDNEIAIVNEKQIHLENVLRETTDTRELPNLIKLVNQKNGLVRKQNQYNILMKQVQLELEQRNILNRMRSLSLVPEENKTQLMLNEEEKLFNRHLELVNEKDELVHHLHTQEQAIQEDEDIQEAINTLPSRKEKKTEDECSIQ